MTSMENLQKTTKEGHMYRSIKRDDGTYSKSGYIKRALELIGPSELKKYFNQVLPDSGAVSRIGMSLDYYGCLVKYGATVADYFEYEFWKKRAVERKKYITKKYSQKIQKTFNTGSIKPLSDKLLFNQNFKKFRGSITYFTFDKSEEEFIEFVHECDRNIIAKPITGFSGNGIFKPDVSTDEKARSVYKELKATNDYFFEKVFIQTGILGEIHPYAVNTIRFYTLNTGKEVHPMFAAVRFGGNKEPVDNIHSGGMSCEVDLESGCIVGKGYNLKGDSFTTHPLSGKLIPGVQIPNWEKICETVKAAAQMLPDIGYIGWDVAVSNEEICLIEGNECANIDLPQTCGQRGLKPLYKQYMK